MDHAFCWLSAGSNTVECKWHHHARILFFKLNQYFLDPVGVPGRPYWLALDEIAGSRRNKYYHLFVVHVAAL